MNNVKTCTTCHQVKPLNEFAPEKRRKLGKSAACKLCRQAYNKEHYERNKDRYSKYKRKYYQENKERLLQHQKALYEESREAKIAYQREYYQNNKDSVLESRKRYYEQNRDKILEQKRSYMQENKDKINLARRSRYKSNFIFSSASKYRNRLRDALKRKGFSKRGKSRELLGCDWETLVMHLESQFVDGMSWDNRSEWHIDHIVPLASAETEEELLALNHYTNLQPLWAEDNMSKGAKHG